ncbi:unnamed protein product [Rotaria sp. Silwood2]|nr:unnamed protein product [Rotaria sp. Silwood2]
MISQTIETQQQLSTMIPFRYRILLYLNILLVVVDICINAFSEFLAPNAFGQLIIYIIQDVCIILSLTLLVIMVLTTYVAQAGLLCLLLRMFRFSIVITCLYLVLCAVVQGLLLSRRFSKDEQGQSAFRYGEVLAFYVIQRTFSVLYYYGMKRAAYRLSDPHFYQSSKWLQDLWEKRRNVATMRIASAAGSASATTTCVCCTILYLRIWYKLKRAKRRANMDYLNPIPLQQIYGAPIGGLGCGTIGRGFRGEFCRYQLVPGLYEFNTVDANTFTVCIRRRNTTTYCQVLTPYRLRKKGLRSWNCAFPKENGHYQALYPQSWTTYDLPNQNIRLLCKQLSPVIPHNYKDSSLPVASFLWYIENLNDEPVEVSLMFTWQAGSASQEFSCRDISHESIDVTDDEISASGVSIKQTLRGMRLEYCIMGKKELDNTITTRTNFNVHSSTDGRDIWLDLTDDGRLTESKTVRSTSVHTASCVCITTTVEPNSIKTSEFVLVWHMPIINFGLGQRQYRRWYTKFFDTETLTGSTLCIHAMKNRIQWEEAIAKWQQPILDDESLPEWYKSALFNESYFIADGGSMWLDVSEDMTLPKHVREWGRFGYLEGHEYRMINTYDVHFYASFALIQLWPQLELSIQYDFASSIDYEKRENRTYLFHGRSAHWKTLHSVPHDLGDPDEEPWLLINAYISHDTAEWKDLNLKYLLQIYRDYVYTQNKQFLIDVWPTVKMVTDRVKKQDTDGDGLVDNGGFADQTYDAWAVTGASAYCGNLHIAALRACVEMARMLKDTDALEEYDVWLKLAKKSYSDKLWNGTYYNYDSSVSRHHDCIMSDQLAGFWYLRLSGHKYDDFEKDRISSVLNTIFNMNVMAFGQGKIGAVNGMTSSGQLEVVSMQSEEIWTGVTYGLSSTMIMENLKSQAFITSEGIYNTCYNVAGLAFQTPEALMRDGHFRSCGYMRPLSIWAIQKALELSCLESNTDSNNLDDH